MFALKANEKRKVHQISFWVRMLYCHWRQTMDFVLSWQVYHLAFKLELINKLYLREFNDINCKDGKVLHIYLVSVRVYTKFLQQCVFENNFKNIFIDLHLSTFLFAKDLKEHTTILDDYEDIKFQCKSQLQQYFWFTFVISTINKTSNSYGKLLTNHKLCGFFFNFNTSIFKFIRKRWTISKHFACMPFLLTEI